jgi:hypothetical protein
MGSHWTKIKSACGARETDIEFDDLELNPFGVECCPKCVEIIAELEKGEQNEQSK